MYRDNKVILLVGRRKTGKSTLLKNIVERYKGEKVLIYDESHQVIWREYGRIHPEKLCYWKKGIKRMYEVDTNYALEKINNCFHNGLVIFEDATKYIKNMSLQTLLTDCRHRNVDVILVFHSLAVIPPRIYEGSEELLLLKTNDTEERLKHLDKIPHKDLIIKALRELKVCEDEHKVLYLRLK